MFFFYWVCIASQVFCSNEQTEYEFIEYDEMNEPSESDERLKLSINNDRSFDLKGEKVKSNEVNLIGYRVELKWSSGKWYRGTVCDYDSKHRKHFVFYDDGDKRWYHLPEMVFRFVKEEDEWNWVDAEEEEEQKTKSNIPIEV